MDISDRSMDFEHEIFKQTMIVRYIDLVPGKYEFKLVCSDNTVPFKITIKRDSNLDTNTAR